MPLVPGYNFVRARAARAFVEDCQLEHRDEEIEVLSLLGFLRMVQHRIPPKHRCVQVTGFDRLWDVCEDDGLLAEKVKGLLKGRCNWVRNNLSSVYFVLPHDAEFVPATTPQVRLSSGELVDLARVFPGTREADTNRFHCDFSMS